jgi:hypothetical protein
MTDWIAQPCGCTQTVGIGQKREKLCEHRHVFAKVDGDGKAKSPWRRRNEPQRDWADARAKVEHEGCCRICKKSEAPGRPLEAAHVLGREHDEPKVSRTTGEILQELYVKPERIFPACGPSPGGCHGEAERNEINVLQFLTLEEQLQAVKDAGGIEAARIRLEPVTHLEEVREAAA